MENIQPTERTKVVRHRERGQYGRDTVNAILDEALICHVGYTLEGQPYVVPTTHARIGDRLYLHGAMANRMLRTMKTGIPVCVTVTLLDGLVLARSAMNHSMNYRSAFILGIAREVSEEKEKRAALDALVNHVVRGRAAEIRPPSPLELRTTIVLCLQIAEASAKVREGPPIDDEEDYALAFWAGVLPLTLVPGSPIEDPRLAAGAHVPENIAAYARPGWRR
ncbi:MAG TPA: pyridoxamine 5'-phosphate oxidase family protein [Steroidobacteraceae bacterium]|nr:pyridoxamine 5'-phosphate oxidase family protein [Steroidobacteraceae bacterium]